MAHKRKEIEPQPGDKRYIRRDDEGKIEVDLHRSRSQDDRQNSKTTSKPCHGDGHTGGRESAE